MDLDFISPHYQSVCPRTEVNVLRTILTEISVANLVTTYRADQAVCDQVRCCLTETLHQQWEQQGGEPSRGWISYLLWVPEPSKDYDVFSGIILNQDSSLTSEGSQKAPKDNNEASTSSDKPL